MSNDSSPRPTQPSEFTILLGSAFVAFMPYLLYRGLFDRLFWFGDEFDLIDQMDRLGFWRWVWLVFAENFVPLFKVLWGGAVLGFAGSYAAMLLIVWLTHALNVALLGRLMRTCGLPWISVFLAQILFGLMPGNYETLAWSVQWSAMLSITFLLLALDGLFSAPAAKAPLGWALASALSFSRGVLTGPVLALGTLLHRDSVSELSTRKRWERAVLFAAPSLVVAALILLLAKGNHQHLKGHGSDAALFALWYYFANPTHSLFGVESWGWHTVVILGLVKVSLVIWSLAESRGRQRTLFILLLAFEMGNAALLGIGRYHTGLGTTLAPRYQYASLIGIVPMAGFYLSRKWARLPLKASWRGLLAAFLLLGLGIALIRAWRIELDPFTAWRGTDSRRLFFADERPDPHGVPGIPAMEMDRAKALIQKYRLH